MLSGKVFAVFERLAAAKKEDYEAFGGDESGKQPAMMAFRSRVRNPAITTTNSYEETLAVAQQLDLVGQILPTGLAK